MDENKDINISKDEHNYCQLGINANRIVIEFKY